MSQNESIIQISNVTKRFGADVVAVDNVSLEIHKGEFFALLGPSGCGKTTLLRMLAGFETPSEGSVYIDGVDMENISPNHRPVNMVFQSYAVFPHMSVADNVAYGLKVTNTPADEIAARVEEALGLVQLEGYGKRMPDQLSGGQRQRVALARALVKKPKVLLLDEPLSALDAKLREAMQLELLRLQKAVGITFIIVTHDQDEALSMADRIAVMENGAVRQLASPQEIYEYPTSRFVADFIGEMNLFEGQVTGHAEGHLSISVTGIGDISIPHETALTGDVGVAVRPEKTLISKVKPEAGRITIHGEIEDICYLGNESHIYIKTDDGLSFATATRNESRRLDADLSDGDKIWVSWDRSDTLVLDR